MYVVYFLFFLLNVAGVIHNIFAQSVFNGSFNVLFALISLFQVKWLWKEEQSEEAFRSFVIEHRNDLETEAWGYEGVRLTRHLELTQYDLCFSLFIIQYRSKSKYYIPGSAKAQRTRIWFFLTNLFFGIWSLTGFFISMKNLVSILRDTHRITVQTLIDEYYNQSKLADVKEHSVKF